MPQSEAHNILTTRIPTCHKSDLVGDVLTLIHSTVASYDSIDYVYVLDDTKLVGVASLRELFLAKSSTRIEEIMTTPVASAHEHTDRAHIAQIAFAENIKAVPVISTSEKFLGVVPADAVFQIFNEEHTNYLFKAAGIKRSKTRYRELSFIEQVRTRTPWLVLGLFGGLAGAMVVNFFEASLSEQLFVASFIPAIVYIADSIGNQSEMLVVRALGRESKFSIKHYLSRELLTGFAISILLSLMMFALSYVWLHDMLLSAVLSLSIISTALFCISFTVTLPWILKQLGFDPAVASGPIATVVSDVSSVAIYLTIATMIL